MTSPPLDGVPQLLQTAEEPQSSSQTDPNILQMLMLERKRREWVAWAEAEYTKCKNARSIAERQWHINMAFYRGKQYVSPINVPGSGFRLTAPKAPPWRVRMVINKVRVAVRTEIAKLTSSKPMPIVIPATTEDEDYSAARVGEQILKTAFAQSEFQKEVRDWVWWGSVTGNAFLKSYWDPTAVDSISVQPPQDEQNPMAMMMQPQGPQPVLGSIVVEAVSPFHLYVPDLLATDLEKQPYIIHVSTKSPGWVEKNFGFKPNVDSKSALSINEAAFFMGGAQEMAMDSVLVKEMWLKPNAHPDFPQGGLLTIINGKVVQEQYKWPWPFKEFPFYKYDGIPTGEFYTDSVVVDLIPIQKEYNRTKSQMIEIKNLMGKPKLMYPKGSVNPRKITSEPGQAIEYTPGFNPPTEMRAAEVPQSMHIELDRLSSDFDDISGQHEITRGNTPSQVTSGTAISFLQEQDDSKLSYQVASIEGCMQKLGTHYLKYVASYWTDERLVKIVGRDNDYEAKRWRGADLRGNTDVRIQAGSALPYSKAARQALLTEMMTNGWIAPQDGMELMDFGGLEKIMEDFLVDKRQAQRENMKMAEAPVEEIEQMLSPPVDPQTGQPLMGPDPQAMAQMGIDPNAPADPQQVAQIPEIPYDPETQQPWQPESPMPVNSWDNHQAHIHFHNQFRKTQQFELLEEPIKQMFEMHVQAHQYALMVPQMGAAGPLPPSEQQMLSPEGEGDPSATEGAPPGPVPGETEPSQVQEPTA
jgi:hypothetical protein